MSTLSLVIRGLSLWVTTVHYSKWAAIVEAVDIVSARCRHTAMAALTDFMLA